MQGTWIKKNSILWQTGKWISWNWWQRDISIKIDYLWTAFFTAQYLKGFNAIHIRHINVQEHNVWFYNMVLIHTIQTIVCLLHYFDLPIKFLVAKGHFNKDIAVILSITERTVKNHLTSVFQKIDCVDRTQAAIFCIRNVITIFYSNADIIFI